MTATEAEAAEEGTIIYSAVAIKGPTPADEEDELGDTLKLFDDLQVIICMNRLF